MMKKLTFILTVFVLLLSNFCFGQSLKRSTICSVGSSETVSDFRITSSFGQKSVSCSVITNGDNFLRQGFQQPLPDLTDLSPCGFASSIAAEPLVTECGTYYNFEYLGLANPDEVLFMWDFGTDAAPQTSTEMNPSDVAYASVGTKLVTLTVELPDSCAESVTLSLFVEDIAFGVAANTVDALCFGDNNGIAELDIFGGTEPFNIEWSDNGTGDLRANLAAGTYGFTVTDAEGCEFISEAIVDGATDELQVQKVDLSFETCAGANDGYVEVEVIGGESPYTFAWSNGGTTAELTALAKGPYTVIVTDANNCTGSGAFNIGELCSGEGIYDVLTPNGDGINEGWVIEGIDNFPKNNVTIYNRWGDIVWSKDSYMNGDWTGKNNKGEDLPTAAYYYVITYNDENNTVVGGSITIVR